MLPTDVYVSRKQVKADFTALKDATVYNGLMVDIAKYEKMITTGLGTDLSQYSTHDLVNYIKTQKETAGGAGIDFVAFSRDFIRNLKDEGRVGYSEPFDAVIGNLIDYFGRSFISIKEINVKNLLGFADYMLKPRTVRRPNQLGGVTETHKKGVKPQTVKDYMGDIQTLFNAACEKYNDEDAEMAIITHNPFISKKLRIEVKQAPEKRDLTVEDLVKILKAENLPGQRMQLARDVLALSFYLVAMNTVDLYGDDAKLTGRRITYHRKKTASRRTDEALISIKIEPEALPLIRKYRDLDKKRLFSFYKMYGSAKYFNKNVNTGCEQLARHLDITPELTTYYIRHTLATIASEDCGISEGDIAVMLNHVSSESDLEKGKSLKVTRGYIHKRFTKIDSLQRQVLDFVKSKEVDAD